MLSAAAIAALAIAVVELGDPRGGGRFSPLMIAQAFTAADFKTLTGCSDDVIGELALWMGARGLTWLPA